MYNLLVPESFEAMIITGVITLAAALAAWYPAKKPIVPFICNIVALIAAFVACNMLNALGVTAAIAMDSTSLQDVAIPALHIEAALASVVVVSVLARTWTLRAHSHLATSTLILLAGLAIATGLNVALVVFGLQSQFELVKNLSIYFFPLDCFILILAIIGSVYTSRVSQTTA